MTETAPGCVRGRRTQGLARTSAVRRARPRNGDSDVRQQSARDIPVG